MMLRRLLYRETPFEPLTDAELRRLEAAFGEMVAGNPLIYYWVHRVDGARWLITDFFHPSMLRYRGLEFVLVERGTVSYYRLPGARVGGTGHVAAGDYRVSITSPAGAAFLIESRKTARGRLERHGVSAAPASGAAHGAAIGANAAAAPRDAAVLTPAQLRFFALDIPRRGHWNQSIALDVAGAFDFDAFARAFDAFARTRPAVRIGALAVASATRELGADARGTVQRIAVTIEPRSARRAGLIVRRSANGRVGTRIVYDSSAHTLSVDRSASGETNFSNAFSQRHIVALPLVNGKLRLDVIVDRDSVEVFDGDGRTVITDLVFPSPADNRLAVFAEGGDATFGDVVVTNLDETAGERRGCPTS